ncbi:MAG: hypothetical protein R3F11_28720 [Verrucomicrobiales bacterium]
MRSAALAAIAEPVPSLPSGFYDEPVMLELPPQRGPHPLHADGSESTEANGIGYAGSIDKQCALTLPGGRILREV